MSSKPAAPATLTVIARLDAKPGREDEVEAALRAIVSPTRAEDGCRCYMPSVADGKPGCFVVYEQWRDEASLAAHFEAPHLETFLAMVPSMLTRPVQIEQLRDIA